MEAANPVVQLGRNRKGRDYVIGDLHGTFHLLERLLARVEFDGQSDRLLSVGDLCDRGPYSESVLSYLGQPWFYACLGNHGDMLLSALRRGHFPDVSLWQMNGGGWGLDQSAEKQQALIAAFSRLPLAMEIEHPALGRIGIIHAEIPKGMDWETFTQRIKNPAEKNLRDHVLWSRSRIARAVEGDEPASVPGIDLIFCGHTILGEPRLIGNTFYIDTGAFLADRGRLTLVELDKDLKLIQEPPR